MTKILITGCAGFIGSHLALHFLNKGNKVIGIDNLCRNGCSTNVSILTKDKNFNFFKEDTRHFENIANIFKNNGPFDMVIHEAGQVAVTTSVINPREDFEINALGTFNILEATRIYSPNAFFQYASTNKVYGKMEDMGVVERNGRYEYENAINGISENYGLDFYSPYGCSKGTADQYVHDYFRIYGIKSVVLRQSCIYGTHQFGIEDQGWVAWFTIASILGKPITIYGDGKQIRDILWIDDLVDAYDKLFENADKVAGKIFNVGGGPNNTLSLLELVDYLKDSGVMTKDPKRGSWRPGDQRVYVSDISKIKDAINWSPKINSKQGVQKLIEWTKNNKEFVKSILS